VTLLAFSDAGDNPTSHVASDADGQEEAVRQASAAKGPSHRAPVMVLPKPEEFYERVLTVERDKGYTLGKIIRGALGRFPLPVLNYTTSRMAKALAQALDEQAFDIVQVESIHLAVYLPIIRAARNSPLAICDWHNIESELMRRYSEHAPDPLRRAYARRTARQLAALEHSVMLKFDAHVVVSGEEREKLLKHAPLAQLYLIENGVDTSYYSDERIAQAHADWITRRRSSAGQLNSSAESPDPNLQSRRVLFVGSMDYHANIDAVTHFAREVWPQLHARHPGLVFTIVGRDPSPEVKRLKELPGIEVTGTVDDVRPYYYDALMAVIPLRVGGGSRLKILEAMAAGVPVVSTRLGAEGIEAEDGVSIVLADTNDDLREAASDLFENEARRKELAAGGRALVSARYDWSGLGSELVETYLELLRQHEALPAMSQEQ